MKPRSEEDIIAKAPIEVCFGDKKYQIKPLTILKQLAWRKSLDESMRGIVDSFQPKADRSTVTSGLTSALLDFPEKIAELVFTYAPEIPKQEILETATEEQLALAFSAIMVIAYPYLAPLKMVTQIVRPSQSQQQ